MGIFSLKKRKSTTGSQIVFTTCSDVCLHVSVRLRLPCLRSMHVSVWPRLSCLLSFSQLVTTNKSSQLCLIYRASEPFRELGDKQPLVFSLSFNEGKLLFFRLTDEIYKVTHGRTWISSSIFYNTAALHCTSYLSYWHTPTDTFVAL